MVYKVTSHPWINFDVDVGRLQPHTWILIGEALSKCEHLIGSPLKPATAEHLAAVYFSKGIHATTAIEGNTMSEEEVRDRIEGRGHLPLAQEYQGQEVDNITSAVASLDRDMQRGFASLDSQRIRDLHAMVLRGMDEPPDREPGKFRQHSVTVGPYLAPSGEHVEPLIDELCTWLRQMTTHGSNAEKADRFAAHLIAAILAHLYVAWIHPFGDGNGRTARLVEVQLLASSGLIPMVSTNILSNHYNTTRPRYYEELNKASRTGDVKPFIHYAIEGFVSELREQIKQVKAHNLRVAWESYVFETFRKERGSEAKHRQRELALAMPVDRWVTKEEVLELTPGIIRAYAKAGPRMPARDLNELVRMKMVRRSDGRYQSALNQLQAFTSPVAESGTEQELEAAAALVAEENENQGVLPLGWA